VGGIVGEADGGGSPGTTVVIYPEGRLSLSEMSKAVMEK